MSEKRHDELREIYSQMDAIRSMAGRCYRLASRNLEQKDADLCDHIQGVANNFIGRLLKEIHKDQPLDGSSTGQNK